MLTNISINNKNLIFSIPLIFFIIRFLLGIAPGVLSEDITKHFSMNASKFGIFSSMFYIGYAFGQIPIGIIIDNFSARKVIIIAILLCALANLGLIFTDSWVIACFYRLVVGVTTVLGFIGAAKIIREIYPANVYSKMISITFSVGFFGAFTCFLLSYQVNNLSFDGWKNLFVAASIALVILAILGWKLLMVIDYKPVKSNIIENLKLVLKDRTIILVGLSGGLMVGASEGFADVWGTIFLQNAYHITKWQAVCAAASVYLGIGIGSPIVNIIAEKYNDYPKVTYITGMMIAILFFLVIWMNNLNYYFLVSLCLLIGILSSNQVLIFSMNTTRVSPAMVGVTAAVTNTLVMSFGFFFHTLIGYLMDHFWEGNLIDDQRIYSVMNYQIALSIIPVASLIGSIIIMRLAKSIK